MEKDVPLLRDALPDRSFRVALLKGMGNYLCLQNMDGVARLDLLEHEEWQRLRLWAVETATGDVGELDFSPPGGRGVPPPSRAGATSVLLRALLPLSRAP